MKPTRVLLTAASTLFVSQVMAGEAVFYITEDGTSMADVAVTVNGQKQLVGKSGFVTFDIDSGTHKVELSQYGEWVGDFEFATQTNAENAEVQVEVLGGEALEEVLVYTPGQEEAPALGQISGYLESDETGGAVTGARISIAGTEQAVMTDEEGFFAFELPRGEYDIAIAHPNYGKRDVSGVRVMSNVNTGVNLTMSMSGDGVIEEVVAVGSYIPSTATAQERDSSAVLDAIGSEQMARFGDSNAASALKRVVGVSVADGKYVVVRGLNERHSAIMLNGASLPSPDPSRRVVPLDIFPSSILDGVEVQKSFTPDVFADSTGGVVKLSTKKFPSEFEGKFSASLGYVSGLTLSDREVQQSQSLDILGVGNTGDRELPGEVSSIEGAMARGTASPSQINNATNAMSSNMKTEEATIMPNTSIEVSMGNTIVDDEEKTIGYTASVKYSNSWSREDRESNTYIQEGGVLRQDDDYKEERTSNDINLGLGMSWGLIVGESEYSSNTLLLRQTLAENSVRRGIGGDQDRESIGYKLGWYERQFLLQQFTGDHYLPELMETTIKWQASLSQASLDAPDERTYSFERDPEEAGAEYELFWSSVDRVYNELVDDNTDFSVDFSSLVMAGDTSEVRVNYGLGMFARERTAEGTRLTYSGNGQTASQYAGNLDIDDILDRSTAAGVARIQSNTSPSDDYDATWDLTSYYLSGQYEMFDTFKVLGGFRSETSDMTVDTFTLGSTIFSPESVQAKVEDDDLFPMLSGSYYLMEDVQIRAAYYETKNRPDFRELANAQFIDPETGDPFRGNPGLTSSEVENIDIRAEWYFSDSESITLAYFTKDFSAPIERTLLTGADVFSYENGSRGEVSGIELDFRREFDYEDYSTFISGNLAFIDSEVEIEVDTVVKTQSMQGQADKLANLQAGLDDYENGIEYTLVMNYQGESLDTVAGGVLPNVMREPRLEMNFNFSAEMGESGKLKFAAKNLTQSGVELTQGGQVYRKYDKDLELSLGYSFNF